MMRVLPSIPCLLLAAVACEEPAAPDRDPPVVTVVSPSTGKHDVNGDGLIDVVLEWRPGDVDPASVRVFALDGVAHETEGAVDLLEVWQLERLDSAGLDLRETIEDLARGGASSLRIEAADHSGNVWGQVVEIDLPPMEPHRTVAFAPGNNFSELATCADDDRLYMVRLEEEIIVLDGRTFDQVGVATAKASRIVCPTGIPYLLFSGENTGRINRETMEVQAIYATTAGIAWTPMDPNRFYLGRTGGVNNQLMVFTVEPLAIDEWIDVFPPPQHEEWSSAVAISEHARRIFVSNSKNGVRALDFDTHEQLDYLSSSSAYGFDAWDMEVSSGGGHRLYTTVRPGIETGLGIFDALRDTALTVLDTEGSAVHLGVSPSGRRAFVTTYSPDGFSSRNYLFDTSNGDILRTFAREPDENGNGRDDGPVEFSRDGRLLFTTHWFHNTRATRLDIYLNRESRNPS